MIEPYFRHGQEGKLGDFPSISERDQKRYYSTTVRNIEGVQYLIITKYYRESHYVDTEEKTVSVLNNKGTLESKVKIQLNDVGQIISDLETLLKKYNSWVEICNSSPDDIGLKEMPLEPTLKKYIIAVFFYYFTTEERWIPRIDLCFLEQFDFWEYPLAVQTISNEAPICDLIEFFTLIYNEYCGENSLWSKLI